MKTYDVFTLLIEIDAAIEELLDLANPCAKLIYNDVETDVITSSKLQKSYEVANNFFLDNYLKFKNLLKIKVAICNKFNLDQFVKYTTDDMIKSYTSGVDEDGEMYFDEEFHDERISDSEILEELQNVSAINFANFFKPSGKKIRYKSNGHQEELELNAGFKF